MSIPNYKALNNIKQYAETSITTGVEDATPHRLIQMLMEGVLTRISSAKLAVKQGRINKKGEDIGRALSIINGLRNCLDHEVGGDLVKNLDSLYEYMIYRLMEANLKSDLDILTEVHGLIGEIKTSWDAIGTS